MTPHLLRLALVVLGLAQAAPAVASDSGTRARNLAAGCANCHGSDGVSAGGTPGLRGMSREAFIAAMREFRTGARAGTVMPQLAKGYDDAEVALLADWYAARPSR